jgi:hypothetical protein
MSDETSQLFPRRYGAPPLPVRWWRLIWWSVLFATVVVGAIGAALLLRPAPYGPLTYVAGCPREPMNRVSNANSYDVRVPCARIVGTVVGYRLNQAYDDLQVTVVPGADYRATLAPGNKGRFTVDITGPDLSTVRVPSQGQVATFYGSWVVNRATHVLAMLPAWRITSPGEKATNPASALFAPDAPRHVSQTLELSSSPVTPRSGATLTIPVGAVWRDSATGGEPPETVPAAQIRILARVSNRVGHVICWKAAQTNSLGRAIVRVPLTLGPGHYIYRIYAIATGRKVTMTRSFVVSGP